MIDTTFIDIHCIQLSRRLTNGEPTPTGYELPNGVVVVWRGNAQNNVHRAIAAAAVDTPPDDARVPRPPLLVAPRRRRC